MNKTRFTIHTLDNPDPDDDWIGYAIMPSDADEVNRGYLIGDLEQVKQLAARLNSFLKTEKHDGEISHLDQRLGWKWLDVADGVKLAREVRVSVAHSTIRAACASGNIEYAKLDGKTWVFPQATFLGWLKKPHKRGRRRVILKKA